MLLADLHLPAFIDAHLEWYIAVALIVVGILASGLGDISRLSLTRIWAISGVCFQESIRRRVLWITPLTIAGVIVAVQLLNPTDEQDAIRQTIKYALFATGTLVVLVTIILACTNLPKEIDNRVIYTIVTKPTTRLEIILGKIVGFARVSATLLAIMGIFTYGYAQIRAGSLQSDARLRLESISSTDPGRLALEHYAQQGLLQSKTYARTVDFQQYIVAPKPEDKIRWAMGEDEQSFMVGFDLPAEMFPDASTGQDNGGLVVVGRIASEYYNGAVDDWHPTPFPGDLPNPAEFKGFTLKKRSRPAVVVEIDGPDKFNLIPSSELPNNGFVELFESQKTTGQPLLKINPTSLDRLYPLPQERRRIYVKIQGSGPIRYGVARDSIHLLSPRLKSLGQSEIINPVKDAEGQFTWPSFRGRELTGTQQLKGMADLSKAAIGVFAFRQVSLPADSKSMPVEFRVGIEGSGDEVSSSESLTHAIIDVFNLKTGQTTPTMDFSVESNRTVFFNLPTDALAGGDFDVHLRCQAPGRYLVLRNAAANPALQLVIGQEPFAFNLFKSLLVMWLMSLLVIIVSIFCSTCVSWPIAVVLSVVILLLHWGTQQIGDTNATGMGAQIAKELGLRNPAEAKVISSAVDGLSRALNIVSKVSPDISQFSATEDIERGITIAPHVLLESIKVIIAFGLPLTILAYARLKRMEVAP